jgi:membrane fusion protein, multidrug efflux system
MAVNNSTQEKTNNGQPPSGEPVRTHRILLMLLPVVIIGGAVCGVVYWMHARQYVSTDDAFVDGEIVQISTKVPGTIQSVEVQDNEDVAAGTVLVRIESRDLQAKLTEAEAALEAARARLEAATTNIGLVRANTEATIAEAQAGVEQARAAIESSQSQVATAHADVAAAEAEATRRQADLKRYKSLDERAVSQQQLDAAQAGADAAEATLVAARKRAATTESGVVEAQAKKAYAEGLLAAARTGPQQVAAAVAQQKSAQAAVDQAQATADEAKLNLSYTTITAPVGGRVTKRMARPGQYLQVGQIVLALVQPNVWVTANFKENQIAHMTCGQEVQITVDAYPGQVFHGKVDSIQAGSGARFSMLPPENATGNYVKVVQRVPVKIVFDSGAAREWLLAPGMSVVPKVFIGVDGRQHPQPITSMPARAEATAASKPALSTNN